MEVQAQFMMIKKGMNYRCIRIILFACILNTSIICAQSYQQLKEKEKQYITHLNQGNWEAAAKIINELAMIPDNALTESTIRYKGEALFQLGHYYLHAHFYDYDLMKAISYFERASEYDMYRFLPELYLSLIYNDGKYGVCDYGKSLYWLEKGCEKRYVLKYLLGEIYAFGFTRFIRNTGGAINTFESTSTMLAFPNVDRDMRKAYQLFYEFYETSYIIESKTNISTYDIGVAFMDGTYLPQNYEKAYEYLDRSAPTFEDLRKDITIYKDDMQIADALYRLSQMYRFGLGIIANEHRANQYLKIAALCGNKNAQSVITSKNVDMGSE